jgi:ornithine carbamoyltransferase
MTVMPLLSPPAAGSLGALHGRDLLSLRDLGPDEITALLRLASDVKREPSAYAHVLAGSTLALLFEKPSLRTRVSFDTAMFQLGGHAIYLGPAEVGLGVREPVADVARTLSGMVQGIMARTFSHATLEALAAAATVPVINALSDLSHPCQGLADFQTMMEVKGRLVDLRLAYVGDGNNVANSLIFGAALLGVRMTLAAPAGYDPPAQVLEWARDHEVAQGIACRVTRDPIAAVREADVVYTDTWISMGQESDSAIRRQAFAGFEVNAALMRHAAPDAIFMHCLPAHRGEEVSAEVIDSRRSVIFRQAENRLHAQKAALVALMGTRRPEIP